MLALLLVTWWCSTLLAGLFAHVPILGLLVFLLVPASLISWNSYFAMLRQFTAASDDRVTTGRKKIIAWVLGAPGGLLLTGTVLVIGGFIGDELLELERRVFLEQPFSRTPRWNLWQPLMYQVGWWLLGWMALWLAELSLLCLAIRLRVGWELWKLLFLGAAFALIPLLIVFLIFFLDLPLTA